MKEDDDLIPLMEEVAFEERDQLVQSYYRYYKNRSPGENGMNKLCSI